MAACHKVQRLQRMAGPGELKGRPVLTRRRTSRKRTRVSESEPRNTSEEDVSVRGGKRKVTADGEGSSKKKNKKRRRFDKESASSSVDAGRGTLIKRSSRGSHLVDSLLQKAQKCR